MQRQFERAQEWLANSEAAGEWDDAAFATQTWLKLSPDELRQLSEELVALTQRWRHRDIVDNDIERETVFVFARGFPAQP